jgi:hypothetical protein
MSRTAKRGRKAAASRRTQKKAPVRYNIDMGADTRVLVLYIADRGYLTPRRKWTPDTILADAMGYLGDEHYMFGLELKAQADAAALQPLSMPALKTLLRKAGGRKYLERPSPAFSAAALCGYTLRGNDGRQYVSMRKGEGCVWQPVTMV